jgi:hypothetical protein
MRNKAKRHRRRRPALRRVLLNRQSRFRTRPIYADMTARELSPGVWAVVEPRYERIVLGGFVSQATAWNWIDQNTYEGRAARDRHNRIRMSFNKEAFDSWMA